MILFDEAQQIVHAKLFQREDEQVELFESSNRILAEDIIASMPSPRFNNSAMDGFAVRAEDTIGASPENPVTLKLVSISAAGSPSNVTIGQGECAQCMTGATIPDGADSIIMVENTSGFSDKNEVRIFQPGARGDHIRQKGEEIKEGETLIQRGTQITPSEIGTLATFGYAQLSVSKKPKIAIFGTGNELVEPGKPLDKGQIYNANLFVFADLVEKVGADVIMRDVIKDDKASLIKFLDEALNTCDVVISSGGVSMGGYDYVREVFLELGVTEHFWKVAQKPGKPLFFGTGNDSLIFGLPGNPVSSYIGFMVWVWPTIKSMMGAPVQPTLTGILSEPFPRESKKKRFLFGKAWIEQGKIVCSPASKVGSHMLSSGLDANCILSADSGSESLSVGDEINIQLLPWKTFC